MKTSNSYLFNCLLKHISGIIVNGYMIHIGIPAYMQQIHRTEREHTSHELKQVQEALPSARKS